MQTKSNLDFEDDSNLRGLKLNVVTKPKPDSYFLTEVNKVMCESGDTLVRDNSNNTYANDNYYCFNNGSKDMPKKLVQWKKVDDLWLPRHLTNTSEYKEIDGNVCKVITESCDSNNPSQNCMIKCFLNNKTVKTFTANYQAI
jgi:hypothetical protein